MFTKIFMLLVGSLNQSLTSAVATNFPCEKIMTKAYEDCLYPDGLPLYLPSDDSSLVPVGTNVAVHSEASQEEAEACSQAAIQEWVLCLQEMQQSQVTS